VKTELKTLYKKNPKLAVQAAKVLGYKIVKADAIADQKASLKAATQAAAKIVNALEKFQKTVSDVRVALEMKMDELGLLEQPLGRRFYAADKKLDGLEGAVQKFKELEAALKSWSEKNK